MNTINTDEYEANTCIGIACKAFQLEEYLVEFYITNIDPKKGPLLKAERRNLIRRKTVWKALSTSIIATNNLATFCIQKTQEVELCLCLVQLLVR